jgi:hypothetical protein
LYETNITQHNDPRAVLVKPDLSVYTLDFEKMSVTFPDGKKAIRFKDCHANNRQNTWHNICL